MRVGVIGLGWIGSCHLALLSRMPRTDVVALCDSDAQRLLQAAQASGATPYDRWEELLDHDALDAVFVCIPPQAHRAPTVAALKQGISVFLEKPVARTMEDGTAIAAAARASDAICAVGYPWHGLDLLDDLRRALEGQTVGLLVGRVFAPTQSRPWFVDRTQSGADILERATHLIDLERCLCGEIATVQAATSQSRLAHVDDPEADVDDVTSLTLRFEEGHIGAVHVCWTPEDVPCTYQLDVVASEGVFHLDLDPDGTKAGMTAPADAGASLLHGHSRGLQLHVRGQQNPFQRTVERFLDAVVARDSGLVFCTVEDAKRTLAVALACERAVESAGSVRVSDLLQTPAP